MGICNSCGRSCNCNAKRGFLGQLRRPDRAKPTDKELGSYKNIWRKFETIFNDGKYVEFNPAWQKGSLGQPFKSAVQYEGLKPGEIQSTYCFEHGRYVVLVGTRFGNIVIYEAHGVANTNGVPIYAVNVSYPKELGPFVCTSSFSESWLGFVKNKNSNIGYWIEDMFKSMESKAK